MEHLSAVAASAMHMLRPHFLSLMPPLLSEKEERKKKKRFS
jgi:hypothetical protein